MSPLPSSQHPPESNRHRWVIWSAIVLLLVMAVLVATVVPRVPPIARIIVAASDVALAVVLWVMSRKADRTG